MEFQSNAHDIEELVIEDDSSAMPVMVAPITLEVEEALMHEHHEPHQHHFECPEEMMEVSEPVQIEIVIEDLGSIPGLNGKLDPEKEKLLEVVEDVKEPVKDEKADTNDAKSSKKADHWNWSSKGAEGFLEWIQDRFKSVPKHSGFDSSGIERASAYLEKLDNEISKAMRMDLDGELDADKIEDVRSKIEDGIERLEERLEKIKKKTKKKKASVNSEIVKEAQKITGVQGIYVTVPLLISSIARTCINGYISAGHDIEGTFSGLCKKYKLTDREKTETIQLI